MGKYINFKRVSLTVCAAVMFFMCSIIFYYLTTETPFTGSKVGGAALLLVNSNAFLTCFFGVLETYN